MQNVRTDNSPENQSQSSAWRFDPRTINVPQHLHQQVARIIAAQNSQLRGTNTSNQSAVTMETPTSSESQGQYVVDMGSVFEPSNTNPGTMNINGMQINAGDIPMNLQASIHGMLHEHDENQNTEPEGGGDGHHGHTHNAPGGAALNLKNILLNSLVFIVIILIRLLADHMLGVMVFIGLGGTFFYANMSLTKFIHESSLRDAMLHNLLLSYFWIVAFLTSNIGCVYFVFREQELWNVLLFQLPSSWQSNLFYFTWTVVVSDFILKYVCIIVKAFISMVPMKPKQRGKYYMFVEHFIQLYRMLIPIVPWVHFLSDGVSWVLGAMLLCFYFIFKAYQVFNKGLELKSAVIKLTTEKSYGVKPTNADIKERGESCPICHEDYKDPVLLSCKHIFCEDCISVWFDRERNCPMCRAQVHTESSMYKDGTTSMHVQWY